MKDFEMVFRGAVHHWLHKNADDFVKFQEAHVHWDTSCLSLYYLDSKGMQQEYQIDDFYEWIGDL